MENTTDQLRQFMLNAHFGINWVDVDFKTELQDVSFEEANTKVGPLNTIAGIVYHLDYYITLVLGRLKGGQLASNANNGFDLDVLASAKDWEALLDQFYKHVDTFAAFVGFMEEKNLQHDFLDKKYGNNIFNIQGIIEHGYYHLGQIVLLKKLIRSGFVG